MKKINRAYNSSFKLPGSPLNLGAIPGTKNIKSEACTVQIGTNGTRRACGLPAHYVVGANKFCRDKHQGLAFATAKKSRKGESGLSTREQLLMAACQ